MAAAGTTAPMSRPRRRLLLTLLALSIALNLFFVGGAAWSRLHARSEWPSPEQRYQQMAAELDLDSQQRIGFDRYVAAMRAAPKKTPGKAAPLLFPPCKEFANLRPDRGTGCAGVAAGAARRAEFH